MSFSRSKSEKEIKNINSVYNNKEKMENEAHEIDAWEKKINKQPTLGDLF